jgi:hypothetical protein
MASNDPYVRTATARIGGYARWINVNDRQAATAGARKAAWDRFERQVDPDGTLPPEVRAQRADAARKAYYTRLSYLAVKAKRAKKAGAK